MSAPPEAPHEPELHARELAALLPVVHGPGSRSRFEARLRRARRRVADLLASVADRPGTELPLDAEWILDNRHLVASAADQVIEDLTPGFYGSLPKVKGSEVPRIEVVATSLVATGEGYVDAERASEFLRAFQTVDALEMSELWAVPAFLRLAVLEDLAARAGANRGAGEGPGARSGEGRVASAITSLRAIDHTDWKEFFESLSLVDRALRRLDPARAYGRMDFQTRDLYRKAVEELARWSGRSEVGVVRACLERVRAEEDGSGEEAHLGVHLLGRRRRAFERAIGCRVPFRERIRRAVLARAGWIYGGGAALLTSGVGLLVVGPALASGASGLAISLLVLAAVVPASAVALALANFFATHLVQPRPLPKLDFSEGIPDEFRTCVVVPALLTDGEEIESLVRGLERNYLGNPQRNLLFALLTDPPDAAAEVAEGDAHALAAAEAGVRELNVRYGREGRDRFFLLHRGRRWNPAEGRWMGWERKRGKLEEFNRRVLGAEESELELRVGRTEDLTGVRYALTLDADTFLPQGTAARLAGTLAHPLNRARFDDRGRVVSGYTVLQPRVDTLSEPGGVTWFSRIFHRDEGLDLYTHAVSDVYQDLFGAGIYAGKGLYEVASFERSLRGRVPENALLSHDLFEGEHGRVGLVSDVSVLEDFPRGPAAFFRRMHRWIRGDWQLLPWLFPRVPSASGGSIRNDLPLLSRWKIADNLRRSLLAPSLVLLAVIGWLLLPSAAWWWTGWLLAVPGVPLVLGGVGAVRRRSQGRKRLVRARFSRRSAAGFPEVVRWGATIALLPWEARIAADAILRTLTRLLITRRHLLEWRPAAHTERALAGRDGIAFHLREAGPGLVFAGLIGAGVVLVSPAALPAAAGVIAAWMGAPLVARALGRRVRAEGERLDAGQVAELRRLARRTWAYFERFTTPEDHWLPPDHLQISPDRGIAHRTSPTNIGFGMLSGLLAYDLGYLPPSRLVAVLASTVETLEVLERHRGHFLNWYDTRTLAPLLPRYVSTVDSGNLAACLLALERGLAELEEIRYPRAAEVRGLVDVIGVAAEVLRELGIGEGEKPGPEALEALALRLVQVETRPEEVVERIVADAQPVLREVEEGIARRLEGEGGLAPIEEVAEARAWLQAVHRQMALLRDEVEGLGAAPRSEGLAHEIQHLRARISALLEEIDFRFLYDSGRELFHVGYNVDAAALDRSYYDLFASEARLASFVAIAQGDVPVEHWLRLGRPFARAGRATVLQSWAGTIFEYLLPPLFIEAPRGSLSEAACMRAIEVQMALGERTGVPWGISESAYSDLDPEGHYRYRGFGAPELGLRRIVEERMVVAPYASALALPFRPAASYRNLTRLRELKAMGSLGFFDAVDFGDEPRPGRPPRVVGAVMAHHQGMVLAAAHHLLTGGATVRRVHAHPPIAALEYLLHEESPERVRARTTLPRAEAPAPALTGPGPSEPWGVDPMAFPPPTMVVSNGRLNALLTTAGAGGLRWEGFDALRWRADPTSSRWGSWIYVRDLETDEVWSATEAPTWTRPDRYEVIFAEHAVEYHRDDGDLRMRTTVAIAPGSDVELRRIVFINEGDEPRELQLTSFGEVALARPTEDRRHPAFSKLFVEVELLRSTRTLLFRRRTEGLDTPPLWLAHSYFGPGEAVEHLGFEVDRAAFFGRPADARVPSGVLRPRTSPEPSGAWAPLDPIFSESVRVVVPAGGEVALGFVTSVASSREGALRGIERFRSGGGIALALDQARDRERALRWELGIAAEEVRTFQRLLTALVFPYHPLRGREQGAPTPPEEGSSGGRSLLWSLGVSGDLPVAVLGGAEPGRGGVLDDLLRAHAYWESHGVRFDLLVVGKEPDGYGEPLRNWLTGMLSRTGRGDRMGQPGGIHYAQASRIGESAMARLKETASLFVDAGEGPLGPWLDGLERRSTELPPFVPMPSAPLTEEPEEPIEAPADLDFFNGLGGFAAEGREYRIHLEPGRATPAPWVNVVANPDFGFVASESGGGVTWDRNSGERRLTPWANDPVCDPPGEALYLRDEETGAIWTVTPSPAGEGVPMGVRHRPGSTAYHRRSRGLDQRLELLVPKDERVKIAELTLENRWSRTRRITLTYYAEWVLGPDRTITAPHLRTGLLAQEQALVVDNRFSPERGSWGAFLASDEPIHGFTCDRTEFLGSEGDLARPAGLGRIGLAGATGAARDPCGALQVHLNLAPGERRTVHFYLGAFDEEGEVAPLLRKLRARGAVDERREEVERRWDDLLGRTRVSTPEPAMDHLLNGWLLYQALSCRLWARTALYQSSGAFGFRDQLQDAAAVSAVAPDEARARIREAARHQFEEGDVLHWWHHETEGGVRTRCSDDLLWLPWVVARYVETTGDEGILDDSLPFLRAPELEPGRLERYDRYTATAPPGSLYQHCLRALDRAAMLTSPRGLPLIGSGDWNDGLNRVGVEGRGESIWSGWFQHAILRRFARICASRGEAVKARELEERAEDLRRAVEEWGWDGRWYVRATDDEGHPLGSARNREGRIDSLPQSWAVLSGGGHPDRAYTAMESVWRELVRRDERLVLLLDPPYQRTPRPVGYIKSYPPGVRENGGQYTHAAAWAGLAFAALGDGERAEEVFRLLNPILRSATPESCSLYRTEPYVVTADVYAGPAHAGRGGWSWYTGAAGWLYTLGLEGILGIGFTPGGLRIDPCIPSRWRRFEVRHRHGEAVYRIVVSNPGGVSRGVVSVTLDGTLVESRTIPLDGAPGEHLVRVVMGAGGRGRKGGGGPHEGAERARRRGWRRDPGESMVEVDAGRER